MKRPFIYDLLISCPFLCMTGFLYFWENDSYGTMAFIVTQGNPLLAASTHSSTLSYPLWPVHVLVPSASADLFAALVERGTRFPLCYLFAIIKSSTSVISPFNLAIKSASAAPTPHTGRKTSCLHLFWLCPGLWIISFLVDSRLSPFQT